MRATTNSLLADLWECGKYSNYWFSSSLFAYRASKRRFVLGYLHQPLSTFLLAGFITFFLSSVLGRNQVDYFFYVLFGLATWHFASSAVTGSVDSIFKAKGVLKQIYLPFSAAVLKATVVNGIGFLVEIIVLLMAYVIYTGDMAPVVLYPIAIAVSTIVLFSFAVSLVVAYFGNLLPDLSVLVPSVMRGLFFVTPIFWYAEDVGPEKASYLDFNPFYWVVSVMRDAVLKAQCSMEGLTYLWLVTLALLIVIALCRFNRNRVIARM